jgi:hypothetical protein
MYLTANRGGGDTVGMNQEIQIGGAKPGATNFLANPAGSSIYFNATTTNANKFSNTMAVGGVSISYSATAGEIAIVGAPIRLPSYTVATLPTCGPATRGGIAYVTDATNATYNGAVTGGGTGAAANVPVFCNGAARTSH